MSDEVTEKVLSTLAAVKRIPREKISLETPLHDLGFDSLDTISMLFELEDKFQISIPDEEARSIRSVGDIVEGVRRLVARTSLSSPAPAE